MLIYFPSPSPEYKICEATVSSEQSLVMIDEWMQLRKFPVLSKVMQWTHLKIIPGRSNRGDTSQTQSSAMTFTHN